ncbi:hypothetical protein OsJ_29052 [Oryza sativa Japonica Group]|uniref:Malectin-like domain-containing protein n=1 Tax=Oryza sativa subsp. japonica TaxID=39947 RepID=B9G357_ORYSJ|nr:hypothetical protein OsJ_29052 [Oryza sativa Japonica Group]
MWSTASGGPVLVVRQSEVKERGKKPCWHVDALLAPVRPDNDMVGRGGVLQKELTWLPDDLVGGSSLEGGGALMSHTWVIQIGPDVIVDGEEAIGVGMGKRPATLYPNDPFDRYWWHQDTNNPMWENLTTTSINIKLESSFEVPAAILKDAVQVAGNSTILNIKWQDNTGRQFAVFLHFADFQDSQVREFNVYFNSGPPNKYRPHYLAAGFVYSTRWYRAIDGDFNVTLAATPESVLPPMLNAYEIYTLISMTLPPHFNKTHPD